MSTTQTAEHPHARRRQNFVDGIRALVSQINHTVNEAWELPSTVTTAAECQQLEALQLEATKLWDTVNGR